MANLETRLQALEQARKPGDYVHKLSILVPDDATDQQFKQARHEYQSDVYRESADPFATSFLG